MREGRFVALLEPLSHQGWVEDVKQIDLNIAENPFIQAYQTTYHGNGVFAIYEAYHNGGLICVLAVHGYDYHGDSMTFKNGRVNPEYRDVNGDGYTDVVITAEIEHWGDDDNMIEVTPMRRVFVWRQNGNSDLSFTHDGFYEELMEGRVGIINNEEFYEYKQLTKEMNEQLYEKVP